MALTKEQKSVVLQDSVNGDDLEAVFPAKLKSDDWNELTWLVFRHVRNSEHLRAPVEMGWCWIEDGDFRHARPKAPKKERAAHAIPMVLIHRGDAWRPDSALRRLAHQQFGHSMRKHEDGWFSSEDLRTELLVKLREWESFARQFYEPIRLTKADAEFCQKPLKSKAHYQKALKILSSAPPRVHPRRSTLAEGLINCCGDLRALLKNPTLEPADLTDAVNTALEAGKLYAWLDVAKDPQTLKEHRKAAAFQRGRPGPEWRRLEHAIEQFREVHERLPTPRELLKFARYKTDMKRGKVIKVHLIDEVDGMEDMQISWGAFQKRIQLINRRLCPGEPVRGRPRRARK